MAAHGHWWQEDANAIFRFLKFLFWGTAEIVMASYYYHSFLFKKKFITRCRSSGFAPRMVKPLINYV
jgi:hypothetical protein